jgi:HlyD family secretion protein
MIKRFFFIVIILAVAIFAGWKLASNRSRTDPNELNLSGNVDIREVVLGFRVPGRVAEMLREEGDAVSGDEILARLDPEPFERELEEAQAQLAAATARLQMYRAGYRQQEIDQAAAVLNERRVTFENARMLFERHRELAKTQVISEQDRDDSEARFREAEARLKSAGEQLNLLKAGFRAEEIAAAEAEAQRAEAGVRRAELRLRDATLRAPENGIVLTRVQEAGAVVQAGAPILTLSLISPVWVRTYIHQPQLGRVRPGMAVQVFTDSRPGQPYKGQIGYISPRAEFTPRNVETEELRTSLVYRMRIVVEDRGGELRQGMPVTVRVPLIAPDAATDPAL